MTSSASLGLKGIEGLEFFVQDIQRMRTFLSGQLDFPEVGASDPALETTQHQRSAVFQAAGSLFLVTQPIGLGSRVHNYLSKHPEGVGTLIFRVADIEHTAKTLAQRGATLVDDIQHHDVDGGRFSHFEITTPFGDTLFRFVQRPEGYTGLYPGMTRFDTPRGGSNRFGFREIDHITSNFMTMKPALLWMEHVLGFKQFWDVAFHTDDVTGKRSHGSGLVSVVMWDPESGIKFANNEPRRPHFEASQIYVFCQDQRGDGIQHAALVVEDIISAVRGMRETAIDFMPTPGAYYDALEERIKTSGINHIDEDIGVLRELEVLIDGAADKQYLLQIFMKEGATQFKDPTGGPFFFEVIQRKGDEGFGAGNFRALFESIERQQKAEGRI